MMLLLFIVAFIVAACLVATFLLGMLLIASVVRDRNIAKRRKEREAANASAYADPWENFPPRWSPTHNETHLGKSQIGRRAA